MKKKALKQWLEAMRSGSYGQCVGALRNEDGFSPLGILCDISCKGKWEPDGKKMSYLGQINYLPKEVSEWSGMKKAEVGSLTAFLITFNDSKKLKMLEIADLVEGKYTCKKKL